MTRMTLSFWAGVLLCALIPGRYPRAVGQYRSTGQPGDTQQSPLLIDRGYDWQAGYPYRRQATTRLPTSRRSIGGFVGNPYRNDRIPPAGLPIGRSLQDYYATANSFGGGNPFANRPVSKPFSNVTPYQPLITSREVGRIEITRGLWW